MEVPSMQSCHQGLKESWVNGHAWQQINVPSQRLNVRSYRTYWDLRSEIECWLSHLALSHMLIQKAYYCNVRATLWNDPLAFSLSLSRSKHRATTTLSCCGVIISLIRCLSNNDLIIIIPHAQDNLIHWMVHLWNKTQQMRRL